MTYAIIVLFIFVYFTTSGKLGMIRFDFIDVYLFFFLPLAVLVVKDFMDRLHIKSVIYI